MKIVVVCEQKDEIAREVLETLRQYGYQTMVLQDREPTEDEIFVFTLPRNDKNLCGFTSKCVKISHPKIAQVSPYPNLPFQVAILGWKLRWTKKENLGEAVLKAVKTFEDFLCEGKLPWSNLPTNGEEVKKWLEKANRIKASRQWQRTYVELPKRKSVRYSRKSLLNAWLLNYYR